MAATLTLKDIQERYDRARRHRQAYEGNWIVNLAYLNGEQYTAASTFDSVTRLVERDVEGPRPVHNVLQKVARTEQTKLLKTSPVPMAMPMTDSDDDVYTSKILTAYFHSLRDTTQYDAKIKQAAFWAVVTGNAFFKWYWDGGKGEAQFTVVPPFDMYPDPNAGTFGACRWAVYSQFMDEDTVGELYGIDSAKASGLVGSYANSRTSQANDYGQQGSNLTGVVVNEYWEPPSRMRPKGTFVAYTGNETLYQGDFPFAHGRLPFTHWGHIEQGTSKWAASVFDQVRDLQDELNRVEAQIIENRNLTNGKMFIPSTVQLDTEITSEPRQVIRYTGDMQSRPQDWFVTGQGMAGWVANEPARIKETIQDLVHQHEVSNGGVPGRVESGQAIQLLQETDDSVLKQSIHSCERAIGDGFLQLALLFRQYGKAEHLVRVYDKNNSVQTYRLMKDKVPANLRVVVRTTTGLPNTIAGKWDRVMNLLMNQVIDPQYALELLDVSPQDPDLRPEAIDIRNADAENTAIMSSQAPVLAQRYDNHLVHLARHDRFCKTPEYRDAVARDPEVKHRFEAHHLSHLEQFQVQMQEQQQIQQLSAPPQEGAAPGQSPSAPPAPQPPPPADNGSPGPVA